MTGVGRGRELDGSVHWFGKYDVLVFGEEFEAEEIDEEACCKSILASSPTLEPGDHVETLTYPEKEKSEESNRMAT